ncbi:MAG: YraN family protein [Acetatifactor sp.]|nr:YraN family protein [Acetatifactor sp.]
MEQTNKRALGTEMEDLAASYLERHGAKVLERNFRSKQGEIDLIARHGEYLVFCEVKYRKSLEMGTPQAAVTLAKQKTICRVADYYRLIHGMGDGTSVRYDVIAIHGSEVTWIQNAFPHHYAGKARRTF